MGKELKIEPRPGAGAGQPRHYQRRERRYPFLIPIEVSGIDRGGQPFCENTLTSDVSQRGCRFTLKKELDKDAIVAIRVLRTLAGKPGDPRLVMFQIIYARQEQDAWTMGAWTLQPDVAWCPDIPREVEEEN
jgi:PilZ domain